MRGRPAAPPRRRAPPAKRLASSVAARHKLVPRSRARSSPTPARRVKTRRARRPGQARELRAADPHARQRRRGGRPHQPRGRYDCVAVKRDVIKDGKVVGLLGHPFVGTADFKRFTYVWCKDNKVAGENGRPLAKVPIPAVCIGAEGRPRVGDGYLSSTP